MGEKSKRIGDLGENVVERTLSLIGWSNPINNFDVECHFNERHERAKNHGMDFLVYQRDPLLDTTQDNIVISSKYLESYPKSTPNTPLKGFLKSVADAIECIKLDETWGLYSINPELTESNWAGVIFWLCHEETATTGVLSRLTDLRYGDDVSHPAIYVVDNERVNFLMKSILYAQSIFPNDKSQVQFVYPNTGMNIGGFKRITSGSRLPLQYINSSVLPLKVIRDPDGQNEEILVLSILDKFDRDDLKRVLGLAQNLTENWASQIVICFPDYHRTTDEHDVLRAKQSFQDNRFIQKVRIDSWNIDLRSLEGDPID